MLTPAAITISNFFTWTTRSCNYATECLTTNNKNGENHSKVSWHFVCVLWYFTEDHTQLAFSPTRNRYLFDFMVQKEFLFSQKIWEFGLRWRNLCRITFRNAFGEIAIYMTKGDCQAKQILARSLREVTTMWQWMSKLIGNFIATQKSNNKNRPAEFLFFSLSSIQRPHRFFFHVNLLACLLLSAFLSPF